jgi:hypothetical protein
MKEEEQTCDVNSQAQLRQSLWEFAWHHTLEAFGECQVYLLLLIY